jgi:CDP-diacylglycerol--serine O-phosphatidyltransferase
MILKFGNYQGALLFIILSAFFDFGDGFAARLLNAYSHIGKELDSLADVVSFGVAPGCIAYTYLEAITKGGSWAAVAFIALLLPVFSALRLAKFNIDTRQTTAFLGLPVPANALFWASLIPSLHYYTSLQPLWLVVGIVFLLFIFCFLMVSEIPMFSLKFKSPEWKSNQWPFSFILLSFLLYGLFFYGGMPLFGISAIIVSYIVMSLIKNTIK